MSCSCQKSRRKQKDTEREREGRKESGRHGSNLIDQLRIRWGRNDGCLRTAYTRIEEREGEENECERERERETEKKRMTSTAAETDYKKRREGGGGRSNVQPSAFLLYCRISGDFNQGSLSSLSLSLCFAIARSRKISLLFYFCLFFSVVHACQLAALDPTHRARSTILLLRRPLCCQQ